MTTSMSSRNDIEDTITLSSVNRLKVLIPLILRHPNTHIRHSLVLISVRNWFLPVRAVRNRFGTIHKFMPKQNKIEPLNIRTMWVSYSFTVLIKSSHGSCLHILISIHKQLPHTHFTHIFTHFVLGVK